MIKKFNEYNENLKPLSDDMLNIEEEKSERLDKVEIIQITGIISEDEAKKIDENFVIHAGDFSGKEIKRGEIIWLSCLMKKPGLTYTSQQQGVLKCRVTDIFLGLSKLNSLM